MDAGEVRPGGASQQAGSALRDAQIAIGLDQQIDFRVYNRIVLPIDGYVFWQYKRTEKLAGLLEISQEIEQSDDQTYGAASVSFATSGEVVGFTRQPIDELWVGVFRGTRFAFPQQRGFFAADALWHYLGRAISPIMAKTLLDEDGTIDPTRAIVSNSLPLWLAMNAYTPIFRPPPAGKPKVLIYPAKFVPPNLPAPYITVRISEGDTESLQYTPIIDPRSDSSYQLMSDRVRVKLVGLQADEGIDFYRRALLYMSPDGPEEMGLMEVSGIRDSIERQAAELQTVSQEKVIDFRVSYVQQRVREVAWQFITSVTATFMVPAPNGTYQTLEP